MRFDIITIFPEAFESYFNISILKRAQQKKIIKIYSHNLRKWTTDKHQTVDDRPFGGGAGMIFKLEPIFKAVQDLKRNTKSRVVLFSPRGKVLNQRKVKMLSHLDQIILICPRYEGVDERVASHLADDVISIGNYVLSGGELPAMVLVDAVSRLIPGVIKEESLKEESFSLPSTKNLKFKIHLSKFYSAKFRQVKNLYHEYPQYTRPAIFYPDKNNKRSAWRVPKVLLSGDHQKIEKWKKEHWGK